ncbi:MAG: hypothetical protein EBR60_06660 [Burkholderiaceae bacterium]|nr:hypothetical protein [Burkholderiaceae bacterium]
MPDQLQLRGGTTAEHSTFTGASKEVTVDTTKKTAVVHDGTTAGGLPLMREDASNAALALGSVGTPSLKFTGDTNTGIYSPGADTLAFVTAGANRLHITSGGLLGLGTSSPDSLLNLSGSGVVQAKVDSATTSSFRGYAIGTSTDDAAYGAVRMELSNGEMRYESGFAGWGGFKTFYTNGLERLRITSGGLVGIGTTTVDARLLVSDGTNINTRIGQLTLDNFTGEGAGIRFSRTTSDDTLCGLGAVNAGDGDLGFFSRNNLIFATGGASNYSATTERARIDSSGRLLVGTSSASGANLLQVNSDALVYGITVGRGAGAISSNTAVGLNALNSNTTGNYNTANGYSALYSNTTGTQNTANGYSALNSNTTGNYNTANGYSAGHGIGANANTTGSNNIFIGYQSVGSSATVNNEVSIYNGSVVARFQGVASAWAFVSDARDKANIQDLTLGLDFIAALKPRKFEWNLRHTDADQGKQAAGFIAQEVLETIETFDASYTNLVDTNDPNQYTFAQSNMIPVLVNAVQELTIIVKELQLELAALKGA